MLFEVSIQQEGVGPELLTSCLVITGTTAIHRTTSNSIIKYMYSKIFFQDSFLLSVKFC